MPQIVLKGAATSGILNTVWQVGGALGISVGQAYLTAQTSSRYVDVAASMTARRIPVTDFLRRYQALAAMHHLAASTANAYLEQIAMTIATVRAYGDTFLLGALLLTFAIPLSLFLPHRYGAK